MSIKRFVSVIALCSPVFASVAQAQFGRVESLPNLSENAIRDTVRTMRIVAPLPVKGEVDVQATARSWVLSKIPGASSGRVSLYFGKNLARGDASAARTAGLALSFD